MDRGVTEGARAPAATGAPVGQGGLGQGEAVPDDGQTARRPGRQAAWVRGIVPALLVGVLVGAAYVAWRPLASPPPAPASVGSPGGASTSRGELDRYIAALGARIAAHPNDASAAARLADALLRQARVTNNAGLSMQAEQVLSQALAREPEHYEALRAMGAVLLSQHRFREAMAMATRAQRIDPADAWNDGVIGDGHLELGEYDAAFAAFDRMMRKRPSAAAYARASYARELQGDLPGALTLMRMAADATSASDPEAQAWHYAQIGDLLYQRGDLAAARTEYARAAFTFPEHPFAAIGLAKVQAARQDYAGALAGYEALMARAPSPFLAARIGELQARLGRPAEAARAYALAADGWRHDTPEPTLLAAFLASHDLGRPPAAAAAASGLSAVPSVVSRAGSPANQPASPPAGAPGNASAEPSVDQAAGRASLAAAPDAGGAPAQDVRLVAVALTAAEQAATMRRDIFTMDALAWARFKAGRLAEAREASAQARRTGTRDRVILYHAAAIAEAAGDDSSARTLVDQALEGHPTFDLVAAPEAAALRARLANRRVASR